MPKSKKVSEYKARVQQMTRKWYPRLGTRGHTFEGDEEILALVEEAFRDGMRKAASLAPKATTASSLRGRIRGYLGAL